MLHCHTIRRLVLPLGFFVLAVGCDSEGLRGPGLGRDEPGEATPSTQPVRAGVFQPGPHDTGRWSDIPAPIVLDIRFTIVRALVPADRIAAAEAIWKHVDEQVVPAEWAAHLKRNGLRVGRGTTDSWPAIRAALKAIPGVQWQDQPYIVHSRTLLTLQIDRTPHDQSLFLYRSDGSLVGATFNQSVNALRIEFAIPPSALDSVAMRITPEIWQRGVGRSWELTSGGFQLMPASASRGVHELAVEAGLPPNHFLLLGPAEPHSPSGLIGAALLEANLNNTNYKSLFFFTPEVFRLGEPSAGAADGAK
jgi:hypothetical protein